MYIQLSWGAVNWVFSSEYVFMNTYQRPQVVLAGIVYGTQQIECLFWDYFCQCMQMNTFLWTNCVLQFCDG